MPFSSGTYSLPGPALSPGDTVSSAENNQFRNDVATAFNETFLRDGTAEATANLPMDGFKLTGLGAGTTAGDSARYDELAALDAAAVKLTGNQTIAGTKTFSSPIAADITGNAATVTNGVYTTGDQTIAGTKTFSSAIAGNITGNAATVTNGVYTTGDQTIAGVKTFSSQPVLPQKLTSGTAQNTTSGTSIDFTGIPSWARRITVSYTGISTNGTSIPQLQLGSASGGIETSGYAGGYMVTGASALIGANFTTGLSLASGSNGAADVRVGISVFTLVSGNTWCGVTNLTNSSGTYAGMATTTKTLSGVLDRIRLTTVNGTDTFDAGSINILYE